MPLKSSLIFLVEWFLKCLNICFRDFFFRAGDIFFNLRVFLKFLQYLFRVYDILLLSLIILLFSWRMIVLAVQLSLENRGFTAFQKFLVSKVLLEFKLLNYCCFAFLKTFAHLFLCFLQCCKFTKVLDLLNLLLSFDLNIISFLSLFVMKGLLLFLIFFVCKEQKNLAWIEISQKFFQMIS